MKLRLLIGVAIIVALFYSFKDDIAAMPFFSLEYFLLAVLAYFVLNLLLAFRIHYLLRKLGLNPNFKCVFAAHLGGMIAGDVTPGRSGYLSAAKLLQPCGCGTSTAMAAILAPQGMEFIVKGVGALLAIAYFHYSGVTAGFAIIVLGVAILILLWSRRLEGLTNTLASIPFGKYLVSMREDGIKMRNYAVQILAVSLAGWLIVGMQWYFVGKSLGMQMEFIEYFLLQPLLTAFMFVPITPAGLGIMESASVVVLYMLGIEPSIAAVFAVLTRLSGVIADLPGVYAFVAKAERT